jgi:CheY-like chemotaxis protein
MQRFGRGFTIVIIDDDPAITKSLGLMFQTLTDLTVVTADNGVTGLEQCVKLLPYCAIVDVKMPGMDGFQVVRALRGDPKTEHISLIMLTAMASDRDRFIGNASGADFYLIKPVRTWDLIATVQQAIARGTAERHEQFRCLAESSLREQKSINMSGDE